MNRRTIIGVFFGLCGGLAAGIGVYTFLYAEGASYLTNDPEACMNCHVMRDHFDAWTKSSHHAVAVCNDCHAPHSFLAKYAVKGINGFNHSLAFTTGRFHEPIQITEMNRQVTEQACRYCHQQIVDAIDTHGAVAEVEAARGNLAAREWKPISCLRCHDTVGHLE